MGRQHNTAENSITPDKPGGSVRLPPLRCLGVLLPCLALLLGSFAQAVEVKILNAERFEKRPITLPGGKSTELYVIEGSPVRLQIGEDKIVAEYVEFDEQSKIMRIVGAGMVNYNKVRTQGRDYILDLKNSELSFNNVFIFTKPLDVEGVAATRLPGQIDITAGAFSPCSRCQQGVQDYRFRAARMNYYPGDRLVAFDVTVFIKDAPIFFLPLMVVPLGPDAKRPRFELERGSRDNAYRASVSLDWPYVLGPYAYGTSSLRYYAEVTPGLSSSPVETILGGTVDTQYLGGGFEHHFFTSRGRGRLEFFYTPDFIRDDEGFEVPARYKYIARYNSEADLPGWQTTLILHRDDATNQGIFDVTAKANTDFSGFSFAYITQTYFDLLPDDDVNTPDYEDGAGALKTFAQAALAKNEEVPWSVGPFSLTTSSLTLGYYEDYADTSNPSAEASGLTLPGSDVAIIQAGRAQAGYNLTLDTISPFPGSSLTGSSSYTGNLYTTTNSASTLNPNGELERLVDWNTNVQGEQRFWNGSFSFEYNRVILEGETPFQFDSTTTPNNRTDLTSSFSFTPLPWLELKLDEAYVFSSSRGFDELGPGPLNTHIGLLGNVSWIELALDHSYNLKDNDPGRMGALLELSAPEDTLDAQFTLSGIYDLDTSNRITGYANESEIDAKASVGYQNYLTLEASLGYDFNADPMLLLGGEESSVEFDDFYSGVDYGTGYQTGDALSESDPIPDAVAAYTPLSARLILGSLDYEEGLPGVSVGIERNLNGAGKTHSVTLEAAAPLGPLQLKATQLFDYLNHSANESSFSLTYPDIIELKAVGFTPLGPLTMGLYPDPQATNSYQVSLTDLTQQDTEAALYELTYETSYGPLDNSTADGAVGVGFQDTNLTLQSFFPTRFLRTPLGPVGLGVQFDSNVAIADALLPITYLSSGSLELTTDFFSRLAVQGKLSYSANYNTYSATFDQRYLTLDGFGVTVRPLDDLYISALLYDTWDYTGNAYGSSVSGPGNFQPIISVTLDRCCWALKGAVNTETGAMSLSLGYPGSTQGLIGSFDTPFILPDKEN